MLFSPFSASLSVGSATTATASVSHASRRFNGEVQFTKKRTSLQCGIKVVQMTKCLARRVHHRQRVSVQPPAVFSARIAGGRTARRSFGHGVLRSRFTTAPFLCHIMGHGQARQVHHGGQLGRRDISPSAQPSLVGIFHGFSSLYTSLTRDL